MSLSYRSGAVGLGLASVILLGTIPLAAQERPGGTTTITSQTTIKKPVDPTRRVPNYFGDLGLTDDQREAIYKVRARYQPRLDELKKQTIETNAKILEESESVLTAPQKEILVARRRAAAETARAKLAASKEKAAAKKAAAAKDKEKEKANGASKTSN